MHEYVKDSPDSDVKGMQLSESDSIEMSDESKMANGSVNLTETFYITAKKNTVFRVKLTEKGLTLRKENKVSAKEQTVPLQDIIGCRCLRSKRRRNKSCTALPGPAELKVVDESSLDHDESDVSAYLYIYAYILKNSQRRGNSRRERTTITLRFRSFDKYADNNREAQKWRTAIKQLIYLAANPNCELPSPIILQSTNVPPTAINMTPPAHSVAVPTSPLRLYMPKDTRKVLILLNPKSGSGKAREMFQKNVAPVFIEAEVQFELHITKYANYAREFVRSHDIYSWRSIVVVGGDGIYYEVINGLFERPDWQEAFDSVPIGIIPCGSGNGLARTIAYLYKEPYEPKPVLYAALTVVRGHCAPMDLVRVETKSQIMFSCLSIGWGLISDIDIESERLRSIGYQRFAIWSVHRLINLRTYHGTLSYLPAVGQFHSASSNRMQNGDNRIRQSKSYNTTLNKQMDFDADDDYDDSLGDVLALETNDAADNLQNNNNEPMRRPRCDSWYSAHSQKTTYFSTTDSFYKSVDDNLSDYESNGTIEAKIPTQMYGPASNLPALTASLPDNWVSETGEFIMVHAAYQSHIGSDCFFAPSSTLSDGIIWLMVIRAGASRQELFKFLVGLSSGTHIPSTHNEHIRMIPVTAFRIEPTGTQGQLTVDGERVEYGPIQCEIFQGISKALVPCTAT